MRRADDRPHRRERGRAHEDALADERVLMDKTPLGGVERAGLLEDRVGDSKLADVVQLGCELQILELRGLEAEATPNLARERRDVLDMLAEPRLALGQRAQERLVCRAAVGGE